MGYCSERVNGEQQHWYYKRTVAFSLENFYAKTKKKVRGKEEVIKNNFYYSKDGSYLDSLRPVRTCLFSVRKLQDVVLDCRAAELHR